MKKENEYEYYLHHTASKRGYISRKNPDGVRKPYKGRFGAGYTIERPRWDTTQYIYIDYYIRSK